MIAHFSRDVIDLQKLREGKTKLIFADPGAKDRVIVQNKNTFSLAPNSGLVSMPDKADLVTSMACDWFSYLDNHEVANHFIKQLGPNTFLAHKLDMILVECVVRRKALGSYCKRHPQIEPTTLFREPVVELFYKSDPLHDPLIMDGPEPHVLNLYPQNQPTEFVEPTRVTYDDINIKTTDPHAVLLELKALALRTFLEMEVAWKRLGVTLIDSKIECGFDQGGRLLVGDTIDADCWRAWLHDDPDQNLDRQYFYDGVFSDEGMEMLHMKYQTAAKLTERLIHRG